ncbi:MAG: helix-turn-helix transcriptional regulator, partial [Ruminococcus sp.]|nr:helix-turn-helix transcriptional regulator [Ruminococcus sp.]
MIFADKLIDLRKKNGMSQEELAEKMNVSRQSVSKWEGAQSMPDLNKIVNISKIFGVTTDYLLNDEIDTPENQTIETADTSAGDVKPLRKVSMEEASEFL